MDPILRGKKFVINHSTIALIKGVIAPTLDMLKVYENFANIKLQYRRFIELDPVVKIDEARAKYILINLIQDAILYSPKNSKIVIELR
jgi:signal transduction histidine kinase